jgi:hypothetical protein
MLLSRLIPCVQTITTFIYLKLASWRCQHVIWSLECLIFLCLCSMSFYCALWGCCLIWLSHFHLSVKILILQCSASDFSRDYDGACLQMRMSYSPAAHLFLFLVQWTDCHLAGALGLLRILIYKVVIVILRWDLMSWFHFPIMDVADLRDLPYALGLCGWHNHHVYPWKKSKYKRVLW